MHGATVPECKAMWPAEVIWYRLRTEAGRFLRWENGVIQAEGRAELLAEELDARVVTEGCDALGNVAFPFPGHMAWVTCPRCGSGTCDEFHVGNLPE